MAYFEHRLRFKQDAQQTSDDKLRSLLSRAWTRRLHRRACVLHRLQGLFWRVWTLRALDPGQDWAKPLGLISLHDNYIYDRADYVKVQLQRLGLIGTRPPASAAMDAHSSPTPGTRAAATARVTRKVDDAGIPATPGSARSRKKRSGRR